MLHKLLNVILALFLFTSCSSSTTETVAENNYKAGTIKEFVEIGLEAITAKSESIGKEIQPKKLVAIDPGHQKQGNSSPEPIGPGSSTTKAKVTGGTSGKWSGLKEYELTLQVSLKLKDELIDRGYNVIMTRETNDIDISNSERAAVANDNNADVFIRIHANGSENSSANGALTICQTSGNPYNKELYSESYRLSQCVLNAYVNNTGIKKERIWETDTMSGINWCQVPVTILEMGYMSNQSDDLNMADASFQEKMVKGIANGIDDFFS